MVNLISVLNQLEQERTRLASQLRRLNVALSALKVKGSEVTSITAKKRTMSAAARRKIAAAQKARWAKWRKAQKAA